MWARRAGRVENGGWGGILGAAVADLGVAGAPAVGPETGQARPPGLVEVVFRNRLGVGEEREERERRLAGGKG
jgi:hypothetical protein